MNPYQHDKLENFLDIRLVDCFIKQNQGNEWLTPTDVASWVFQTNKPTAYHEDYVLKKMFSILGMMFTREEEQSFLVKGKVKVNDTSVYAFRLKDECLIEPKSSVIKSVEKQVEEAFIPATQVNVMHREKTID